MKMPTKLNGASLPITAFDLLSRYIGLVMERGVNADHPLIQWWLSLCGFGLDAHDEIPWCSAAINGIAWELRLPRSKSAAARSWMTVGQPVRLDEAVLGFDVVVLSRGLSPAAGHVGFFAGRDGDHVFVLGGNQHDTVSIAPFDAATVLGVRRLLRG